MDDLIYHVHPILRKKPKHIIHIDASFSTFRETSETLIKETLLETSVTFSAPNIRLDINGKKFMRPLSRLKHGYIS